MEASALPIGEQVLIHAPFGRDGALIQQILLRSGIQSAVCCNARALEAGILEGAGAAIIADEALFAGVSGSLAECLRRQPSWSDFPLLILTSGGDETEGSRRRLRFLDPLGNVTLLERPLRTVTLVSSVRTALCARQRQYQIRDHIAQSALNEQLIRASEQRFRAIIEANPFGLVIGDLKGGLQYCNPVTLRMLGYSEEDVAAGLVRWDQLTPPEFAHLDAEAVRQLACTGSCEPYEKVYLSRDGHRIPILVGASLITMPSGEQAVAAFVTDLTVLKQTEKARQEVLDALQSANERLRQANSELEEFAYVASHDIQEPLRMVNSYTQLLLRRHVDTNNTQAQEYGKVIQDGVKRMERLISDLLSYSRTVQSDKLPSDAADLNESLQKALSMLRGRIEETKGTITHGPLPRVRGEEGQLAHVFQNLLSNALKYHRPNEAPLVHVSAERNGEEWVISVRDNGIGFEQRHAEKIFGLFKRLYRDEYPGTGLGLAICKRIVERFGGTIWATSELGRGSTFSFSLPEDWA